MHSYQSIGRVLLRSAVFAVSPGRESSFEESSDFLNLLILPLSVYFAKQLFCQCNSSAFFVSTALNILSIVSVLAVFLTFRRSSDDSFSEHNPCTVALNRDIFF